MYRNLLSKPPGLNALYCYCYFILAQDSRYLWPNRSSPPTEHSIFLLHAPSASITCALQNSYLSIHLCPGQRVSQTGRLQGQKGTAASSPSVQLGGKKKKTKKKKGEKKQVGLAKRLPAKETAHEQSRHFMWRSSMRAPSVPPLRLAGIQRESQLTRGEHLSLQGTLGTRSCEVPLARARA